jgi:predicted ester cyclase
MILFYLFASQTKKHGLASRLINLNFARSYANEESQAFPDISFKLLSPFPVIAEEDYVVARWFGGGKHTGQAFFDFPVGGLPQANSGKEMRFSGTTVFTLKDGKIVEEIGEESALSALQQLGLIQGNAGPQVDSTKR